MVDLVGKEREVLGVCLAFRGQRQMPGPWCSGLDVTVLVLLPGV